MTMVEYSKGNGCKAAVGFTKLAAPPMLKEAVATTAAELLMSLGWEESAPNSMMCSADPATGGIIDSTILTGEWFAIFNDDDLGNDLDGFATREDAARAALERLAQHQHFN